MTRQQEWAKRAFEAVNEVGDNKDVISRLMNLPNLLLQSGALQTIVFLNNKVPLAAQKLVAVYNPEMHVEDNNNNSLIRTLTNASLPTYLSMSRDLIECAVWLRRFAQTKDEANGGEQ